MPARKPTDAEVLRASIPRNAGRRTAEEAKAGGVRTHQIALPATPEYSRWLTEFAEEVGSTRPALTAHALALLASAVGFGRPPHR